jgi:hypothetical protein
MQKAIVWAHELMDFVALARFSYLDVLHGVGVFYFLAVGEFLAAAFVSLALIQRVR